MSAARLRAVLELHVARTVGRRPRDVALLLSGGVDSQAVGLAAHHLGHRVHAYTFRLGNVHSYDSKWAERSARHMGWTWTSVDLPTSARHIVEQWPRMYHELRCRKKREFECAWPFLWVYPRVREKYVLNGLCADMNFGMRRSLMKMGGAGKNADNAIFSRVRREMLLPLVERGLDAVDAYYNPACSLQHLLLREEFGLVNVDPFGQPEMYDLLMRYTWQQLNIPRQKQFIRDAYPEMRALGTRMHRNYQGGGKGGISDHFEKVLATPVNYMRRSRTIDMFTADWSKPNRAHEQQMVCARIERVMSSRE